VRRTSLRVCGILSWIRRDVMKKERYLSKQHYNPVIHQWCRETKIQVVMLPLKVTRQTKESHFKLLSKKLWENGKLLVDETRKSSENFPKGKTAVSEVLGWSRFNTAVSYAIVDCASISSKTKQFPLEQVWKTNRNSMAVFILKTYYPSGRTWASICSSSGYASLV